MSRSREDITPALAWRSRLFWRYLRVLVALVALVLLLSGGLQAYFAYQDARAGLERIEQGQAQVAAVRIEQFFGSVVPPLLAADQTAEQVAAGAAEERRTQYVQVLRQLPAITDIRHVDGSGREQVFVSRVALDVVGSGADLSHDPSVQAARPERPSFGPVFFRDGSEPYMTVALAGAGPDGGVTLANVNLKFVWDVVSGIKVGRHGLAYVVDGGGRLIAHPDLSLVLRNTDLSQVGQVRAVRQGGAPRASVARDLNGKQVLSAAVAVDPPGWFVFVEQPRGEAFASLNALLLRTTALLLAGLALAAAASVLLARRMVTPIRALQAGVARLGAGNLDERVALQTGDELQALGEEFDQMGARLRRSYAELEDQVAARTHDLREALALLERKSAELEAVSRHKSAFLAAMSHELRTPLNAVIGFSDVLLRRRHGELNERQDRYVEEILAAGQHLLALINDVLDLARIEAGRMDLDLAPCSLPDAIEAAAAMLRVRAERAGVALSCCIAPGIGMVIADERRLKQVLLNLLSNAVKFTPAGGEVSLRAEPTDDGGSVAIAVADTGIGIAPEDQQRIFEEFRRVEGSPVHEGTGLGLALARRLVELHGGQIALESALGAGSTFTVTLPLCGPEAAGGARRAAGTLAQA